MIELENLLTVKEVAELLGVKLNTVYEAIEEDRLPCMRLFGRKLVARKDALVYRERTQPEGHKVRHRPAGVRGKRRAQATENVVK